MTDKLYKFDVFLSFDSNNASLAKEIASDLRASGLRIWLSEWISQLGDDLGYQTSTALADSRIMLLLVSEKILGTQWRHLEKLTLRFRDPVNSERRFIPIRLDEAPLPETLRQLHHIEWRSEQSREIINRLIAVCTPPEPRLSARGLDVKRTSARKRYRIVPKSPIRTLSFQMSGDYAAYGSFDGQLYVINLNDSANSGVLLSGHDGRIRSVEFHPSKPLLLSSSVDCTVRLWDLQTGTCLRLLSGEVGTVTSASFAGDAIIISSEDQFVQLWNDLGSDVPQDLRGHTSSVCAVRAFENILVSAGMDGTIRVWNLRNGQCKRVLEGHTAGVRCLSLNTKGTLLLSGSDDCTIRLWDLRSGLCLNTYDAHTDSVHHVAWHASEHAFASAGGDRHLRLWNIQSAKIIRILEGNGSDITGLAFFGNILMAGDSETIYEWNVRAALAPMSSNPTSKNFAKATEQIQYTNAKVLLVGDSGAGKTGLSMRLASEQWEPSAASTVGAWATQWSLPARADDEGDREIWLWDFGGQADQRLIHQLYMDDTSLAILVFDAQKTNVFESLTQWDRDLSRSTDKQVAKLLVAGRVDASPVRVSRQDIEQYLRERNFAAYIETSALTNKGCDELRDAIVDCIDWANIPWRSSPILFKRLKEEIVRLKDEGRVLMRFNDLRDALRLRLHPTEINFVDAELRAVLSLLSGPGVVLELEFGAWVLFQPELINAYSQAVIATMRDDPSELGCVSEQRVLAGDLVYGSFKRIAREDERFVLLEMHRKLLQRGLCARELTDKDVLLVFPSYYKRNRPELVGHPAVLVSYRFDGVVDEIYSTLVVRLNYTHEFTRAQLWQDAAEFVTKGGEKIGVKLTRQVSGASASIEVYCDPNTLVGEKIIFVKYVHDHLLQRASNVTRHRHYVCHACSYPIGNLEATERRRASGKVDIGCSLCDERVQLIDDLEELYMSPEYRRRVRRLQGLANEEMDNESKERLLVGDVISEVAYSRQIAREKSVSDHGIDMEIEFKHDDGTASGQLLFLQLKSGDSYLRTQADGKEIFSIKNPRHVEYWANQIAPVMLVVRNSAGEIRWMEIRNYLKRKLETNKTVRQIEFKGERLDIDNILKWRDYVLRKNKND